jgi:hypothetical protein
MPSVIILVCQYWHTIKKSHASALAGIKHTFAMHLLLGASAHYTVPAGCKQVSLNR